MKAQNSNQRLKALLHVERHNLSLEPTITSSLNKKKYEFIALLRSLIESREEFDGESGLEKHEQLIDEIFNDAILIAFSKKIMPPTATAENFSLLLYSTFLLLIYHNIDRNLLLGDLIQTLRIFVEKQAEPYTDVHGEKQKIPNDTIANLIKVTKNESTENWEEDFVARVRFLYRSFSSWLENRK